METNVKDNLQSMALVSAAIQSSRSGRPVRVQALLENELLKDALQENALPENALPGKALRQVAVTD